MQPYEVKLSYLGSPWCTVVFEVGHDEIGDADEAEYVLPRDASEMLGAMGFPEIDPVALMPLQQSFSPQTRSYFSWAAALLAALGITAWLAAYLPSLALAVLMVGYAVFSTIGALHFTVIKRLHKQYKLEEEGNLSRLNRKWVLTLAVLFILSLVSAFVFVLESPKWDALEWVFTICGVPLYFLVFIFTQRHLKKEYAPKFDRAKAMRVSFWVVGVILCLGYAVVSLFVAAPESSITLQSTLEATPNSFAYSPSALMSDTGELSSFVDALVAFGMTKASGLSIAVAFICRFVIYAAVFFGLVNLFNFCLLSNDEIRAEFQPLMIDREEIAFGPILKRYIVIIAALSIVFIVLFQFANTETERTHSTNEQTMIQTFIQEQTKNFIFIFDGEYEKLREFDKIRRSYNEDREKLLDEAQNSLASLINDYYNRCQENVGSYADWRKDFFTGGSPLAQFLGFIDINNEKTSFKDEISKGIDTSELTSQYRDFQNQLISLDRDFYEKVKGLELDSLSGETAQIEQFIEQQINEKTDINLWSILDDPNEETLVKSVLDGDPNQEGFTDKVNELINHARNSSLAKLKTLS